MPNRKRETSDEDIRALLTQVLQENTVLRKQVISYCELVPTLLRITQLEAECAALDDPTEIRRRVTEMREIADAAIERHQRRTTGADAAATSRPPRPHHH